MTVWCRDRDCVLERDSDRVRVFDREHDRIRERVNGHVNGHGHGQGHGRGHGHGHGKVARISSLILESIHYCLCMKRYLTKI